MAKDYRGKRLAIYLRVSTDKQATEMQRRELEDWAAQRGFEAPTVFEDLGVSGGTTAYKRPGLRKLMEACTQGKFDMVAAWSVDRLGRSLKDLLSTLQHFQDTNVNLYIHQQGLDTSTATGEMMFQMVGVFAQFERTIIQERVKAGIERARNETPEQRKAREARLGRKIRAHGRPAVPDRVKQAILQDREAGLSLRLTAEKHGVGKATVARIQQEARAVT